jgi:hypothetical protein
MSIYNVEQFVLASIVACITYRGISFYIPTSLKIFMVVINVLVALAIFEVGMNAND